MKSLKLKSIVTLAVAVFTLTNSAFAQDKIYQKNKKEPIEAKVVEIGTSEIKYKLFAEKENGLIYVVEKQSISKIEFENGRVETYGIELLDAEEYFIGQKRRNMKVSFLGPLIGTTKLTYEQVIKPGRSFEIKATVVGLGINYGRDQTGLFGSFAYKFYKKPTYVTSDLRRRNILQGTYLKPEVFFGSYSVKGFDNNKDSYGGAGVLLNLGKQWVFGDRVVLDMAYGIGYGGGESFNGYFILENLAMGGSLNLGIAF